MNGPFSDHPSEDVLERFLLHHSELEELEIVETHILACEPCILRLETLELNIEATKLALRNLKAAELATTPEHAKARRFAWLKQWSIPRLSFAGASLAACALALTFLSVPRQVSLTAYRDAETNLVSEWVPLGFHLNATALPSGPVTVKVVNAEGVRVWQGSAIVDNSQIDVTIPRLTAAGQYFIQVYAQHKDTGVELLREFSISTKPLF